MDVTHRKVDTRRSVKTIRDLISAAFGEGRGRSRAARARTSFFSRYAFSLFDDIHRGYMQKSAYGSDELGEKWPPIAPSTIAARKITRADMTRYGIHPQRTRGLLSPSQDKLWRTIFKKRFDELFGEYSHDEAKAMAARAAWYWLKRIGAKTRKQTLANRPARILVETGRLERSFRPGRTTAYSYVPYNKDQVYRIQGSQLVIGSRVPWCKHHQHGTRHHPPRPPIPSPKAMRRWTLRAARRGTMAVRDYLAEIIS